MMKIKNPLLSLFLIICLALAGCASQGGKDYTNTQERKTMTVKRGTITQVRVVTTSNDATAVGVTAGGVIGGVLGSFIGGGSARKLGTLGGAAGGAVVGAGAEKAIRDHEAYELTVKLDSGQEMVVVQDPDDSFSPGDRVRVLSSSDGVTRVQRE